MEGDVELPIPTLRPIGVNLAHQAVTMPQAEVKEVGNAHMKSTYAWDVLLGNAWSRLQDIERKK
eukprot:477636-Amphidinium_carterae.1